MTDPTLIQWAVELSLKTKQIIFGFKTWKGKENSWTVMISKQCANKNIISCLGNLHILSGCMLDKWEITFEFLQVFSLVFLLNFKHVSKCKFLTFILWCSEKKKHLWHFFGVSGSKFSQNNVLNKHICQPCFRLSDWGLWEKKEQGSV